MPGAGDVDAYIAAAPPKFRSTLSDLRNAIRSELAARGVEFEECLSYAMPGFRLIRGGRPGKIVAGFAAHTHRCGFYPHSGTVLPRLGPEVGTRGHTRSALHFTPLDPIPPALLARVLDLRLAEISEI